MVIEIQNRRKGKYYSSSDESNSWDLFTIPRIVAVSVVTPSDDDVEYGHD